MRSKTSFWKRSLSAFLSLIMVLAMVPAFDIVPEAEAAPAGNYITMPITIRDFAADGMLFEFNQVGATGTVGIGGAAPSVYFDGGDNLSNAYFTKTEQSGYTRYKANTGSAYMTYEVNNTGTRASMRYCVIKYRTNGGAQSTAQISVRTGGGDTNNYTNLPTGGYNQSSFKTVVFDTAGTTSDAVAYVTIYPRLASGKYIDIAYIAFFSNKADADTFAANDGKVVASATYNQGDTAGFSMLATGSADYINNLPKGATTNASNPSTVVTHDVLPGTKLIENGYWGQKTDPTPIAITLTSGAPQQVYGAWIRTDLVTDTLDADGKPVYTQAAVDYLADYMKQIFAVKQKTNGAYNTYYVMGAKMFDANKNYVGTNASNAIYDLADIFRGSIASLGDYNSAKAKFEAGNLSVATQATTWYEAAYFLLHNTWRDSSASDNGSDGYGMPINQYKNLHLVQTTNEKGETCYVFNSKFDDTKYDYANGEIYNTQTSKYTIAKTKEGTQSYVRGNPLPEARFDPLGMSGAGKNLGYGMSGDIYGDMVSPSAADWAEFYDNTNYNLSLEGHAQFIYYEDSNLYFTFTGDDDVYLYINGIRVLDVGAAHSISKVKINLNDVAVKCGLRDGQAYNFDFFYMERHGTAANFGIETNIKIVDPAMTTNKTGYQNGASTGYNGFVDPNKPVAYSFELQNNGEADIQNLTFTDSDIGVYFGYDRIALNADSNMNEMYLYRYNPNGTVKQSWTAGNLTAEILKAELTAGLAVGEKIGIYGFKYNIPTNRWVNDVFPNTVYTTAISIGDNNSTHTLNGMADWKVQKSKLVTEPFHVYDWVTKDVSKDPNDVCDWYSPAGASVKVTKNELVQPVKDAGYTVPSGVSIVLCSASGNEGGVNINPNAKRNSDGSITYTATEPGLDTVYYKIKGMNYDTMVYHYDVYTYGTVNNVYVLDYGLSVELNGDDFGFRNNDVLTVAQNGYGTTATVTGIQDGTSNYGDFTWENPSLKYTPDAIINNTDCVRANIQILENGATELTKFTGVNMYETVTTAPANVVYYEENFPGITYVNGNGNEWAHYETVDENLNPVAGTEQSADQDMNYGSDPNYAEDKEGTIVSGDSVGTVIDSSTLNLDTSDLNALQASGVEYLNEYLGLGGSDSNGTVNQLVVNKTADVMFFEFEGTGFEIVSRTTQDEYAVINVQVQKDNGDGTYTVVKQKPVITESKGGDLYQVPIISITDLPKAEYRVVIRASGSTASKTRVLYIDGIRIYGPLGNDQALDYYNPEEYQAEFFEIKQLIEDGKMIYTDVSESESDGLELVSGSTLIEDVEQDMVLISIEDVEQYMKLGPNNELYLDGAATVGVIAFFLTPDETTPEGARTIEIGAHRKADSFNKDFGDVYMVYGSTASDVLENPKYEIGSGTEMYYTIDVNNLILDNGKYLVLIGANGCEDTSGTLALTSIKVCGYEIDFAEPAITAAYENDDLMGAPIVAESAALLRAWMAETEDEKIEEVPVNENLVISRAVLKAAKVVSGKIATLTVKADAEASDIVITDSEGNEIEVIKCIRKVSGDQATFTVTWTVRGSRGDNLDYAIRVYDENGLASVNTETVTVTIK